MFYITYENLSEAVNNLFKDYTQITEIITVYNNFRKEATIPDEIIDQLLEEYYNFKDVFNRTQADKLPPYRDYDYKIKLTSKGIPLRSRLYPILGYKF